MESISPLTTESTNQTNLQDIEDLTISLVIKNFNPTLLSYEFLTMSGLVPNTWELAKQPVMNPRGSQVIFKNGVDIIAQGNALNFRQPIGNKDLEQLEFAKVAQQYVQKMSNAEYQGLSIAPKIIIPFPEQEGGKNFIHNTFFNDGSWRTFGNNSVQASLTLSYELDQCRLGVNINPAKLQQQDNNVSTSAVLFAGSFNYSFMNDTPETRANNLIKKLANWQKDLQIFRDLVYKQFLQKAPKQQESLFDT